MTCLCFIFGSNFTTNYVFDFPSYGESFFTLSNAAGKANDKRTSQSQSVYLIFYSKSSKFLEDQRLPSLRNVVFLFWQWVSFFRQFAIIFSLFNINVDALEYIHLGFHHHPPSEQTKQTSRNSSSSRLNTYIS